jgi:hypothetical protein
LEEEKATESLTDDPEQIESQLITTTNEDSRKGDTPSQQNSPELSGMEN